MPPYFLGVCMEPEYIYDVFGMIIGIKEPEPKEEKKEVEEPKPKKTKGK